LEKYAGGKSVPERIKDGWKTSRCADLISWDELKKKYDAQFKIVFDAIRQLMAPQEPEPPKKRIGFLVEEPKVPYITKMKRKG
jgi:hypothetical protein